MQQGMSQTTRRAPNRRKTKEVLEDVEKERIAQDKKWGEQNHDDFIWSAILGEEVGEVCKASLHDRFGGKEAGGQREELLQVAAVAIAWVECIDRRDS